MILQLFIFQAAKQNLLFGFIPESLGTLLFGVGLVLLAVGLRWIFKNIEKSANDKLNGQEHKTLA
jgi:hypothetical protein